MLNKTEWGQAIDDVIRAVDARADGQALHHAVCAYHRMPGKKLAIAMICVGCGATLFVAADRIGLQQWQRDIVPDPVACTKCGYAEAHEYDGLVF